MPRLAHRKARTGCIRCKARKVKCDEQRPACTACARHNVPCQYTHSERTSSASAATTTPPSSAPYPVNGQDNSANEPKLDAQLELRLMHEWTAYTCKTFSTAWEFWQYQAPLIALQFRHVMDSMLALAALHASRQPPMQWVPLDGRMVPIRTEMHHPGLPERKTDDHWKLEGMDIDKAWANPLSSAGNNAYLAAKRSHEMLTVSRFYFDRAVDGHRRALDDLSIENIEAVYVTSILVCLYAGFGLGESQEDSMLPSVKPVQWMRLAAGTRFICIRWEQLVGPAWIASSGVFYGKPDMTDTTDLFNTEHGRPFLKLLTHAEDFESITKEDKLVYQNAISYIGAIYTKISDHTESEMASCRRLMAMPSRVDPRFIDFVEGKQPRAMAILAHLFACMELIAEKVPWFEGTAQRQIAKIYEDLPAGWKPMLAWPVAIMNGDIGREPKETQIDDILAL